MFSTKSDPEHHQNHFKYDEAIISPLHAMVRTKSNIKHHEDSNTETNHKRKLTQSKRQDIHDSKKIISHLVHLNREYESFSNISIDKKAANASWLKLPSINTLPHSSLMIDKKTILTCCHL
ncbi:hypothetical protein O181_033040 [Austropuccinia psidii MF-1]|uniref:Uncharacterized protein n=1 Tax=Austropuccinia psidii MF-1 TaxID=1389203 RepID=A0A9Q3D288_9BASI|nr:hypothetical protein [Austropuccinia psidii MF-1]